MIPSLDDVNVVVAGLLGEHCLPWHVVVGRSSRGASSLGFCVVMDDANEYICSFSSEEPWDDFWAATRVVWSARRFGDGGVQRCLFEDVVDVLRFGV